jgi:hypothetical protein
MGMNAVNDGANMNSAALDQAVIQAGSVRPQAQLELAGGLAAPAQPKR